MADRSEQGGPDRIWKGSGWTMSLQTQLSQLAYFHLNGKAVEFVDVENIFWCVANQESAANEKKHSA